MSLIRSTSSIPLIPISAWYMIMSAMGFALMAACVKSVSLAGIPVLEIVAARAIVSAIMSYFDVKRKKISIWGNNKPLLLLRGLIGAIALIFVYYSVSTLPLAESTLLQYLHPVFTAVLAVILLKETVQRSTLICIVLSLIGLVIIVTPNLLNSVQFLDLQTDTQTQSQATIAPYAWLSIGAGVLGAMGSAMAYIVVKKLTKTEDSSVIIFYFPIVALPISVILLGSDFVMPSLPILGLLILVGIFTQVGQVGLTKALSCEYANKASAYAYIQILFSVLLGWFVFSEIPTLTTLIGGGLVVIGALINILWKR